MASDPEMRNTMAEAAYDRLTTDFGMDAGITKLTARLQSLGTIR